MATKEQIDRMLKKMFESHPRKFLHRMDEVQAGIGAVLNLLYTRKAPVTAGEISEELGVTTARVAVLLKKMMERDLITKERSPLDARIRMIALTENGTKTVQKMHEKIYGQMGKLIDQIGEERLLEYIATANEIRQIITFPEDHSMNEM